MKSCTAGDGRRFPAERRPASAAVHHLKLWLGLLCLAELADLVTTRADRLRGGIEANQVSAFTLAVGGPGLYWGLKLSLVIAMVAVVLLAVHFARSFPGKRARLVQAWITRSMQLCVLTLTFASLGNVVVLALASQGGL
ncbi:MAG: hypothetical protein ACREOM_07895 [Candidatus Dormibacteraceae bacterium]